jgi:trimeric autotransporter adhesin
MEGVLARALNPAGRARRTVATTLVLGLCAVILLVAATPASALTRRQAAEKALVALGSRDAAGPLVVLGLGKPLRPGARVTQRGAKRPIATVGRSGAFFFYEDRAPGRPYPHPGRIALVSPKSGRVILSATITRRPLVNGRLPAFLRRAKAYRSPKYRVFETSGRSTEPALAAPTAAPDDPFGGTPLGATPNAPPKANSQTARAKQGAPKRITLTGSDEDGDLLTFHVTKQPLRGTLGGNPPDLVYTPPAGYVGPDHFTFKVSDGEADSNAAQVTIAVVPLGAPPAVTTSAGCTSYTEQGAAVAVDGQLTVSDPDDTELDSARVRIAANFQDGDDLRFTDQNGISSSYDEDLGVLSLSGTSSVANYQAALSSVAYQNTRSGNATATKDIEFVVNDAGSDSAPATKQVCVSGGAGGSNNPPVGEAGEGLLPYVENDGPLPVDPSFVVGDPDSANLSGATAKFIPIVTQPVGEDGEPTGPPTTTVTFEPAEDELAFVDQNGISGQYDDATGLMTLTGSASLADYETALRSLTYENTSEDPSDALRRLQFQVTDSAGASSAPTTRDVVVTPVNDAPEVESSAGSTLYAGSATAVDPGASAVDVDDADLEGAQVRIATGFEDGDELVFADQLGITGAYDAGTGVLALSGTAPVADYEAALRSVAFGHTGGDPSGERTVELVVNDGDLDSAPATKHVEVNDEPVLGTTGSALSYVEDAGAVAVDPGITASDPESAQLAGATVAITAGFAPAEDTLAFTDQNGIAGDYDSLTGVLTLTGSAPVPDYEAALRSVTYENSSDAPSTATRTVTFQVDDGAAYNNLSDAATRDVGVTAVNDAPELTTSAGSTAYTEGDAATPVDAALAATDPDDASLEGGEVRIASGFEDGDELVFAEQLGIAGDYDAATGVLTLTGTASVADYETALRSVAFHHAGDTPSASRSVQFEVGDGELDSAAAEKQLAVTAVNDKPVLDTSDDPLAYTEGDGAVAVDPGIVASDVDSAQLTGATVTIEGGFAAAEDDVAFSDQNGIAGGYDDTTGVLTLSGSASVADYEAALRSVTYENSSSDPSPITRTIVFQADDGAVGDNLSDPAARDVAVTPVSDPLNVAPVVTTSAGATTYAPGDPATVVDAALTVTDIDDTSLVGAQVTIASGSEPGDELVFVDQLGISGSYEGGVLGLTGTASVADYETALRSVAFRHSGDAAPSGPRSVEFKVNDGDADSNSAAKTVEIASPPP